MKRVLPLSLLFVSLLCSCVEAPGGVDATEESENVGEASEALVTDCPFMNPALPVGAPLPVPVDYRRELMITDLSVIDEPCRTSWTRPCGGGAPRGIWTFGGLMMRMAGTVPPSLFVADWLHSFEVPNLVNGFPVPPRPGIRPAIIDPWLVASGCAAGSPVMACATLDLTKAPFRLLGIVNRSDLSGPGFGATQRGQSRFVFGATANGDPDLGPGILFTVIFEFDNPSQLGGAPRSDFDWVQSYHALSNAAVLGPIGSPGYLATLQSILDPITNPGAEPGNPNFGNAIATVRTNEIAFGGPLWKMREYQLKGTGAGINAFRLRLDPLDQTPDDSLNLSAPLDGFLDSSSASGALAAFTYALPVPGFQGGESSAPLPGPIGWWDHTAATPLTPLERHHFGFGSCNGCHRGETNTAFTHLAPRNPGAPTLLSPFLGTPTIPGAGGNPAVVFNVNDPAPTGAVFHYNEPWRRVCEETRILKGDPTPWTRGHGGH